jgi:hypothetical protein
MPPGFRADSPLNYFALEKEIVVLMSGTEAVKFHRTQNGIDDLQSTPGDEDDRMQIRRHADDIGTLHTDESIKSCEKRLREYTAVVVGDDSVWKAIQAVATKLLDTPKLSARQIDTLVRPLLRR